MKKDWWSLLATDYNDQIEWSPNVGNNLRAKKKDETKWNYRKCKKAEYGIPLGYSLIEKKNPKGG